MNKESFEYGGYHFIPERCFTKEENNFFAISRRQRIDKELGFCRPGYSYESKYPYSMRTSMQRHQIRSATSFRCVENGRLYLPCKNDLQEYVEPLIKSRRQRDER